MVISPNGLCPQWRTPNNYILTVMNGMLQRTQRMVYIEIH